MPTASATEGGVDTAAEGHDAQCTLTKEIVGRVGVDLELHAVGLHNHLL
jgi:hypothetical protein